MGGFGGLIDRLAQLLARLGICANGGIIVGMLTGGTVALAELIHGPLSPTTAELLRIWAVTALAGWIVLLFVLVALARWTFGSVALPALVNAVLVSGLTLFLCRALGLFAFGFWIGIVAGLLVGLLLCGLYRLAARG